MLFSFFAEAPASHFKDHKRRCSATDEGSSSAEGVAPPCGAGSAHASVLQAASALVFARGKKRPLQALLGNSGWARAVHKVDRCTQ